jgi:hypothetical protein
MYNYFLSLIISTPSIKNDGKCKIFVVNFYLLQYWKIIKVCKSCIEFCDFMFCNIYILILNFLCVRF